MSQNDHIKTLAQALDLPIRARYDVEIRQLPDGTTLHTPIVRPARIVPVEEDDILFFANEHGQTYIIQHDEEGAYATPWST